MLPSAIDLLVYALACWRITHMLLRENGPFEVFRRLRQALGAVYYVDEPEKVAGWRFEITVCIWCLSMWVGGAITVFVYNFPLIAFYVALPYALSAVAVMLDHWFGINKP